MNREHFITTGEFAALCGTTKETLFHYDRVGILKPVWVGENGYRYYTPAQFFDFDVIRMLKYTGSSLKEIQEYFRDYDTERFLKICRERRREIEKKKKELEEISRFLEEAVKMTESALEEAYDVPELLYENEERLLVSPIEPSMEASIHTEARILGEHMKKCEQCGVNFQVSLGTQMPREELLEGRSTESSFFTRIPEGVRVPAQADIHIKPEGYYAAVTHKGTYDSFDQGVRCLLDYIDRENLQIAGDGYACELIGYLSGSEEDYVTQIKIQVERPGRKEGSKDGGRQPLRSCRLPGRE